MILSIYLTALTGQAAETNGLVPQIQRETLTAVNRSSVGALATNWPPVAVISDSNWMMLGTQPSMRFGTALESLPAAAPSNRVLLAIGAPRSDNPHSRRLDSGAVFFFGFDAEKATVTLAGMLESSRSGAAYGQSIARIDDLNGDGFGELLIGAPNFRVSQPYEGAWFLVNGPEPWHYGHSEPTASSSRPNTKLGVSMASAGDVNGDGLPDVIVGAQNHQTKDWREGAAFLYLGTSNGIEPFHAWSAHGEGRQAHFGSAVAGAGDVNGDGFDDVLIGSPRYSARMPDAGRVYLYLGTPAGLEPAPAWTADGPKALASMGEALASLGDLNGDGFDDVVIGAPGAERATSDWPGAAFIFLGGANGLSSTPSQVFDGQMAGSMFGGAFAARGNVNGDRFPDLLVGAPQSSLHEANAGRVFLFLGDGRGVSPRPVWTLDGGQAGALCGATLAFVRDVTGDGCDELLIGSPRYTTVKFREGRVDLLPGSPTRYVSTNLVAADEAPSESLARPGTAQPASRLLWYGLGSGLLVSLLVGTILWQRRHRETTEAVDVERKRLARDLHDDLGARLARIALLTELVNRDSGQSDESRKNAQILSETARDVLGSMEQILWSVNPANDTLENLATFIIQYSGPFFAPTGIVCRHQTPSSFPTRIIQPAVRKNIFLTVKEALNNIAKHSGANEVRIAIEFADPLLTIVIDDNGRGISSTPEASPSQPGGTPPQPRRRGNGLGNMRSRMEEIRGRFTIGARPDGGTRVTLVIQL